MLAKDYPANVLSPQDKADMLIAVNQLRKTGCQCGNEYMPSVSLLKWNEDLERVASNQANYLNDNQITSNVHIGKNGATLRERLDVVGYKLYYGAENVSYNNSSLLDVVKGWQQSPNHCRNMMGAVYKMMGAARAGDYWTQVFGGE
ncbi:MAG: CAP domain-containing protein [Chitinophagales bacterium]|nr:CAP domain-containing protein [Chitinophagales bacterium]